MPRLTHNLQDIVHHLVSSNIFLPGKVGSLNPLKSYCIFFQKLVAMVTMMVTMATK